MVRFIAVISDMKRLLDSDGVRAGAVCNPPCRNDLTIAYIIYVPGLKL